MTAAGADGGPLGDTPCFVVTHHKPARPHPPVYTFVTDGVASAIEQARNAAITLERTRVLATPAATHLVFRVVR